MDATTVEVTELDEAALDGAPPCSAISQWRWSRRRRPCKRPATHRVRLRCPVHGEKVRFLCRLHLQALKMGACLCWACGLGSRVEYVGPS